MRLLRSSVPPLLCLAGLMVVWQVASLLVNLQAFPTALEALAEVPVLLTNPSDLADIGASIKRMTVGFALACAFCIPLGLLMGRNKMVADAVNPILMLLYPVPKAALMPLVMLWLGTGDLSKILVIFLGSSIPLVYHSYQGGRDIETKYVWSAQAMGMGPVARLFRIVLPAAMPDILSGARVGISMALIVMVSSEIIGRQAGVGNILFNSLDMAIYPPVYAMILIIGAIGFGADVLFQAFQRHVVPWAMPKTAADGSNVLWGEK